MGFYRLQSEGFELRSPDEQVSYRAALKRHLPTYNGAFYAVLSIVL